MSIILSHSTARALWRLIMAPPRPVEPPFDVAAIADSKPSAADATAAFRYLERHDVPTETVHCMTHVRHAKVSRCAPYLQMHIDSRPLEFWELHELEPDIYLPCIEACALQAATEMPFIELVEYYYELCGTYSLNPEDETDYIDRTALTSVEALQGSFARAKGARGITQAKRALAYVRNGCRSPFETAMSLMIVLPKKMGGLGIRRYQTNHMLKVPHFAAKLTRRSHFYLDGYLESSKTDLEYNGFRHDEAESAAVDEERRLALASMGYAVITISKHSFFDKTAFQRVITAIRRREKIPTSRLPNGFYKYQEELRQFVLRRYLQADDATERDYAGDDLAAFIEPYDPLEWLEINETLEPDDHQANIYEEPNGKIYGAGGR